MIKLKSVYILARRDYPRSRFPSRTILYFIYIAAKIITKIIPQRASFIINQMFLSRTVNLNSVIATTIAYPNVVISRVNYEIRRFNVTIQASLYDLYTGHATHDRVDPLQLRRKTGICLELPRGCGLHASAVSYTIDVLSVYSISRADGAPLISGENINSRHVQVTTLLRDGLTVETLRHFTYARNESHLAASLRRVVNR